MGSCISKCCLGPSSAIHPNQPQDKPVISQSTVQPVSNPSSTASFSFGSSTTDYCSFCSSKTKLSPSESTPSTKESKHIVILDPQKVSNPIPGPKQRLQTAAISKKLSTKRERSSSPSSFVRQKSFRREPNLRSASPPVRQESSYLLPAQRRKMAPVPSNFVKDPLIVNYCKKTERPLNSNNASRKLGKGHVVRSHLVYPEQSKGGRMEDINNPLIAMECFIFL